MTVHIVPEHIPVERCSVFNVQCLTGSPGVFLVTPIAYPKGGGT